MMPSSADQFTSTVDGRLTTSGTVRCGYRVTDTAAVSCYYPPPSSVCDKLYDTSLDDVNKRCQYHHCRDQPHRRGDNRKSSTWLLSGDECGICMAGAARRSAANCCDPVTASSVLEEDGFDVGLIGSAVDLVAETGCAVLRNNRSTLVSSIIGEWQWRVAGRRGRQR